MYLQYYVNPMYKTIVMFLYIFIIVKFTFIVLSEILRIDLLKMCATFWGGVEVA